jgi:hypothetical protein
MAEDEVLDRGPRGESRAGLGETADESGECESYDDDSCRGGFSEGSDYVRKRSGHVHGSNTGELCSPGYVYELHRRGTTNTKP